jgi:hypothetical protein
VFIAGVKDTGDKLSPVSLIPMIDHCPGFHRYHNTGEKFIGGINDIGNN